MLVRLSCALSQDESCAKSSESCEKSAESLWLVQAWWVAHPPKRGTWWLAGRPMVHVGFMRSWLGGGLNTKVIRQIMHLVHARPRASNPNQKLQIYVTGQYQSCHSCSRRCKLPIWYSQIH